MFNGRIAPVVVETDVPDRGGGGYIYSVVWGSFEIEIPRGPSCLPPTKKQAKAHAARFRRKLRSVFDRGVSFGSGRKTNS